MSREFEIAEIGALRSEVNSVIDRMNGNENFSSGTISAIFAFILSTDISTISFVLSLLSIAIVFIGCRRYWELRVHAKKIDEYLQSLEKAIVSTGGWTVYYYKSIEGRPTGGYSTTRFIFWGTLGAICLFGTLYVGQTLFCAPVTPKP